MHAGIACHTHTMDIALTQLVRNTNSRRCTNTQRQHKSHIRNLIRHLMRCQCLLANPTNNHERSREKECLQQCLTTNRETNSSQFADTLPRESFPCHTQVLLPLLVKSHDCPETQGHTDARNQRTKSCTRGTHRLNTPVAIDKHPVEKDIQAVHHERDDHSHHGITQALQELLEEREEQEGYQRNDN